MILNNLNMDVKRIAILNPYLQGGHTETAEIEAGIRFEMAAQKLGIDVKIFAKSEELYAFNPDFVITHTYQDPKLTHFPTYGLLTMPVKWVKDHPRFVRNILSYDGFLAVSDNVHNWLKDLCETTHKPFLYANAAFSLPVTEFPELDYTKATAVYLGTNWDGSRHQNLFQLLSDGKHIKCFGPAKSWKNVPATLYGGEVPFDGKSALATYHIHAAGLCVNHKDFDNDGAPTSRIYEIFASGALAIASRNVYVESHIKDNALYVDHNVSSEELAAQIKAHIEWVRNHPEEARAKAKNAHEIFCKELSMDYFLQNILDLHKQYHHNLKIRNLIAGEHKPFVQPQIKQNWLRKILNPTAPKSLTPEVRKNFAINLIINKADKLEQIEKAINNILPELNQFNKLNVFLIKQPDSEKIKQRYRGFANLAIIDVANQKALLQQMADALFISNASYSTVIQLRHKLFTSQLNAFFADLKAACPEVMLFGSVDAASQRTLAEKLEGEHKVPRHEKMRIGYFPILQGNMFSIFDNLDSGIYFIKTELLLDMLTQSTARNSKSLEADIHGKLKLYEKKFYPHVMGELLVD